MAEAHGFHIEPSLYFTPGDVGLPNHLYWWLYQNDEVVEVHSDLGEAHRATVRVLFTSEKNMSVSEVTVLSNNIVQDAVRKLKNVLVGAYPKERHRAGQEDK